MIPTLLVFGLLFGRWWKTALLVGAVGWLLLLWSNPGTRSFEPAFVASAAAVALGNTAVGVAVHQLLRLLWHLLWRLIKRFQPYITRLKRHAPEPWPRGNTMPRR